MGWSRREKFGKHCGRTLRKVPTRKQSPSYGMYGQSPTNCREFAIVKEVLNYYGHEADSRLSKADLLEERFGFDDGIPVEESTCPMRGNYPNSPVLHSMNKHKRWTLLEDVREYVEEDYEAKECLELSGESSATKPTKKRRKLDEEEHEGLHVTVVERELCSFASREKPDCLRVTSNNPSVLKPVRTSTKNHAHVGDLRPKIADSEQPELYYEFLSGLSESKWPWNRQVDCYRSWQSGEVVGKKSRKKSKGRRNKGCGDDRISLLDLEEISMDMEKQARSNDICDHPGKTGSQFSSRPLDFPIGSYIHSVIQESLKEQTKKSSEQSICQPQKAEHVYGKGDAIYIENQDGETLSHVSQTAESNVNDSDSSTELQFFSIHPDVKTEIQVLSTDIEPSNLGKNFGENYIEGNVSPRTFIIKTDLQNDCQFPNPLDCSILFEVSEKDKSAETAAVADIQISISVPKDLFLNEETIVAYIHSELSSQMNAGLLSVERIVTIAGEKCIKLGVSLDKSQSNDMKKKSSKIEKISTEVIQDICEQKPVVFGVKKAFQISVMEESKMAVGELNCNELQPYGSHCAICFMHVDELDKSVGLTRLLHCSHAFCNECWEHYIITCVQAGQSRMFCPSYECSTPVNEALVWMMTSAEVYRRFCSLHYRHTIATNPKLRSCPAPGCEHLVYVPAECGSPLPIHCGCGEIWCFHCQEAAHWPASCQEAESFRKKHGDYEELKKLYLSEGRITSVKIKRCPFCNYPIEKNIGCQHMSCRCGRDFCWECLEPWGTSHEWPCEQRRRVHEEVELTDIKGNTRYNKYCKIASSNYQERHGKRMKSFTKMVKRAECLQNSHSLVSEKASVPSSRLVRSYLENSVADHVAAMFHFKYLAHMVMENTALAMAVARRTKMVGRLAKDLQTLTFIVERFEEIILDPGTLTDAHNLQKAVGLLKSGQRLIKEIYKLVRANRKSNKIH